MKSGHNNAYILIADYNETCFIDIASIIINILTMVICIIIQVYKND